MYRQLKAQLAWFGSVKVDADLPHDMASVRKSIAARYGNHHSRTDHDFMREILPPSAVTQKSWHEVHL